jgi:hypothetical protein
MNRSYVRRNSGKAMALIGGITAVGVELAPPGGFAAAGWTRGRDTPFQGHLDTVLKQARRQGASGI